MLVHRLAIVAVLLAACSGGEADVGRPIEETTPSTMPRATTSSAAISSTTTSVATTTTVPVSTTTTVAEVVAPDASPTVALDSFAWTFATTIGADGADLLSVESAGVYVGGSFDCAITAGFGGFDFTTRLVVVEDTAHFDDGTGSGFAELPTSAAAVVDNLSLCAGSEVFWADITGGEKLPAGGETEERNGIESRRLDLTGIIDQAGALGLFTPGVAGVSFDQLDFWVAVDGDWINSIEMEASLASQALEDITGSNVVGPGEIRVNLDITQPDDESLAVTAP